MCGIFGCHQHKKTWNKEELSLTLNSLEKRGPDARGTYMHNGTFFGHTRLSIIDLNTGKQPMESWDNKFSITFNGEIYNYKLVRKKLEASGSIFKTNSDTEVIIEAYRFWGISFVKQLEGMFAFSIYDNEAQKIICARDRVGIKPFYYSVSQDHFVFSSTLNPFFLLKNFHLSLDYTSVRDFLTYDYIPTPKTLVREVKKLPPGNVITYNIATKDFIKSEYWSLPTMEERKKIDSHELIELTEDCLKKAVKKQLVSDVPIGALLSGGIDSSLLVAFMAQNSSKPVKTFSISFKAGENEIEYAKLVANQYNTEHVIFDGGEISNEFVYDTLCNLDEPLSDPSIIPTRLVSHLASKHIKVALSGDGGDEMFLGYPRYKRARKNLKENKLKALISNSILRSSFNFRGKERLIKSLLTEPQMIVYNRTRYLDVPLFGKSFSDLLLNVKPFELHDTMSHWNLSLEKYDKDLNPDSLMRIDFTSKLLDNHLFKSDRASMMESLELRVPFLDEDLLKNILPIHADSKIYDSRLKSILKSISAKHLPREVWDRKKQGFHVPVSSYMANEWSNSIQYFLSWGKKNLDLFNYDYLDRLYQINLKRKYISRPLWSPICLIAWFHSHQVTF